MLDTSLFLIPLSVVHFWSGNRPDLPLSDIYFSNPNYTYSVAEKLTQKWRAEGDTLSLFRACLLLTKFSGYNVQAGLLKDVYEEEVLSLTGENPLGKFVFDMSQKLSQGVRDTLQMIPQYVPVSINRIVTALLRTYVAVKEEIPKKTDAYIWDSLGIKDKKTYEESYLKERSVQAYALQVACILLDSLRSALKRDGRKLKSLNVPTPWGYVSFGGPESDSFLDALIVVDAGGDDTYKSVALGIDNGGNDIYTSSVGYGLFSISAFVDVKGDDVYEGDGQGAGFSGFGVLLDLSGNDTYKGKVFTQGAGYNGGGLLIDVTGNDRYYAYQKAQGFGWVKGIGILADLSGNDTYELDDSTVIFPSPQDPRHNTSLGQGVGFGERRDFFDGKSIPGGVGMLLDGGGDDRYSAGVFAQGTGYWLGVGTLYDGGGNDAYSGVWYVQGAAAHFAIGVLFDGDGDDAYLATTSTSQGVGHDFSYGFLIDAKGQDTYTCGNLCLGSGSAQGIGVFWDMDGKGKVNLKGRGLGFSSFAVDSVSLRSLFPTKGVVCRGKTCP